MKEDWEVAEVAKLLCTNNPAERPFAVAKAYLNIYGRMKLPTLAKFTLSICNGSHTMAGPKGKQAKTRNRIVGEAGIAITSDTRLQGVITKLCAVRRRKPGAVTTLLQEAYERDKVLAGELRLQNEENEKAKMARKHINKAIKFNNAVEEPLTKTIELLHVELQSMEYKRGVCVAFLKRQFDARLTRAESDEYNYDTVPARFRSLHTNKLVKTAPIGEDPVTFLTDLLSEMIRIDSKRTFSDEIALSGLIRSTPILEADTTNPISTDAKKAMDAYLVANAQQVDDPWLLFLEKEYKGQVCFVNDIAARHKLYRVAKISYWSSTKYEYGNWEATLEPIHLSSDGSYFVHEKNSVVGPNGARVTMAKCYRGYILAQYIDGDDEEPQRTVCVDEYMTNALERNASYEANCAAKQALQSQGTPARSATHLPRRTANQSRPQR